MAGKGGGERLFIANLPYSVDWKYLKDLFRDNGIDVRHADILEDLKTGLSSGNAVVEVGSIDDAERAIETMNEMEVDGRNIIVREDREAHKGGPKGKGKGKGKDKGKGKGKGRDDREEDFRDHSKADGKGKGRPTWHALPDEPRPSSRFDYDRGPPEDWRDERRGSRDMRHEMRGGGPIVYLEGLPRGCTWQRVKDLCRSVGLRVMHTDMVDREMGVGLVEVFDEEEVHVAIDSLDGADVDGMRIYVRPEWESAGRGGGGRGGHSARDSGRGEPWDKGGRRGGGAYSAGKGPSRAEEWSDRRRGGKDREPSMEPPPRSKRPPLQMETQQDEDMMARRLFAESLDPGVDWKQLKDLFKGFVDVAYADVVTSDGENHGIIEFHSRADALEACMEFNGTVLGDMPLRLRQDRGEFHRMRGSKRRRTSAPEAIGAPEEERPRKGGKGGGGRPPSSTGPRVFVGNLDFKITWQDLKDHMRQAGDVRFCDVFKDHDGRPKGCGIVEYATEEECELAVESLSGTELGTRPISVRWAEERGDGGKR